MTPQQPKGDANQAKQDLLDHFADETSPFVEIGKRLGPTALDVVLGILGGLKEHVPTRDNFWLKLERDLRDVRIRAEFDGGNYSELGERYGIKPRQVRRVLAESGARGTTGHAVSVKQPG